MGCGTTRVKPSLPLPAPARPVLPQQPTKNEEQLDALQSGYVRIHGDKWKIYLRFHDLLNLFNEYQARILVSGPFLQSIKMKELESLKLQDKDNSYSSPLLVINLYKDADRLNQALGFTGHIHTRKNTKDVNGKLQVDTEQYMTCSEELRIIPVEDVISIRYTSQFRKSTTHTDISSTAQEAKYEGKIFKTKKLVDVVHKEERSTKDAKRLITIEIEYYKYMNPDSASILRGLSKEERERNVASMVAKEKLKFNLLNHKDFEKDDYIAKQEQAELLCRVVVHLKTLRVYPSVQALPTLFHQEPLEALGHVFQEGNFGQSSSLPAITTQMTTEVQQQKLSIE